jgi:ribonuclease P protein component
VYLKKLQDSSVPNQVLVSASKKNFKRAVDRNQLKRRMREAYRLNKHVLEDSLKEFYLVIGYIYVGKEIASYQEIEEKLKQSLLRLRDIIGS